jgi:hypothetical protein
MDREVPRHADSVTVHDIMVGDLVKIHGDAYGYVVEIDFDSEPGFVYVTIQGRPDDPAACYLPADGRYRLCRGETFVFGRRP